MKLFSSVLKTIGVAFSQKVYEKEKRTAQKKAYKQTCKASKGKFNPHWHKDYNRALKNNQQKAKYKNEIRKTFINAL